ncbi:MAG: flavin reductase family protein [Bacilli bacterium]|nr:flavin reductase family protein [Bacilli bacterium]
MKINLGPKTILYPMPVLVVSTYDKDANPNAMTAAWGGIYDDNKVFLCLASDHVTTSNVKLTKAFSLAIADEKHVAEVDFFGLVSAKNQPNKIEEAGLHARKSEFVDAPIIAEFPLSLECKVSSINEDVPGSTYVIGEIVNVLASDKLLDDNQHINIDILKPISYDPSNHNYVAVERVVGKAFSEGNKFKK